MTSTDAQYGTEARKFFEGQQAARRKRQSQARRAAAEGEIESRHESERTVTHPSMPPETSRGEPTPTDTREPEEISTGEPSTMPEERPDAEPPTEQLSASRRAVTTERSPYVLRVLAGEEAAEPFAVAYGATTIGRLSGSDILLHDPLVSHHHAYIETTPDRITIRDKNSTNGTLVNGVEISETTELQHGDTVLIGDVVLRLEWAEEES